MTAAAQKHGLSSSALNRALTVASIPVAAVFRMLPRRSRFHAARILARAACPLYRRLVYPRRRPPILDGPREDVLRVMLRIMDRSDIPYDPVLAVHGPELPEGPAVLLTGHFLLTALWSGAMIASGHRIAITAARDELKLLGSDEGPNLLTGPTALVAARNRLRAGGRVHSAPDGLSEHPKWRRVETPAGPRWISGAMARVAEAMKVPVFFAAGALDEKWNVVITIEKPIGSKAADVMNEYVEFFQRRLELKR